MKSVVRPPANPELADPINTDELRSGEDESRPSMEPESDDTSILASSIASLLAERRIGGWLT
jgi:hypothetical protein